MAGLLDDLFEELLAYLVPVLDAVRERDAFEELLHRQGYNIAIAGELHGALFGQGALSGAVTQVDDTYAALKAAQAQDGASKPELLAFATAVGDLILLLDGLNLPALANLPEALASQAEVESFGRAVAEMLTTDYLRRRRPKLHAALFAVGAVAFETVEAVPPFRRSHRREVVDWAALGRLFSDPTGEIAAHYGWDQPGEAFRIEALVEALVTLARAFGIETVTDHDPGRRHAALIATATVVPTPEVDGLRALLIETQDLTDGTFVTAGADVFGLSPEPEAPPVGFALLPLLTGGVGEEIPLGPNVTMAVEASGAPLAASPVLVLPGESVWQVAQGDARLEVSLRLDPGTTVSLLGKPGNAHLSLRGAELDVVLTRDGEESRADVALGLGQGDGGLRLEIPLDKADGFLRSILGRNQIDVTSQASLRWSSEAGFQFAAEGVLAIPLAPHVDLGPVDLLETRLELRAKGDETGGGLTADVRSDLRARVGPVGITLSGLGLTASVGPAGPAEPAVRLGDVALDLDFRPPDGAAIVVESALISGGGFIRRDADRQAYSGQLLLDAEGFSLTALGDLATQDVTGRDLPNPGFSLLILMAARFPPVQIGMGFTLNGIGGLIGLHRRTDFDLLRAGLSTGALDQVLFPDSGAQSPTQVTGALVDLFPVAPGRHLVGPVLRLGWGSPTLVDIDLGVLFRIGGPAVVHLLGRLRAALPRSGNAALKINLGLVGDIDPAAGQLRLNGALRNSSIAGADLTGEMAARLRWRGDETFILCFGGFHPDYRPEIDVPALKRLAMTVSRGTSLRITAEAYLAITSNTLQFGGHAELVVRKSNFSVDGFFDFHALFVFSPFSFAVGLEFDVHLRFKGRSFASVGLVLDLTGPRPWRAKGRVKIKILWVTFKLPFNIAWGSERAALEPPVSAWPMLAAALADPANWRAIPPDRQHRDVIVLPPSKPGQVVVHPSGQLELRQEVLPFGIELDRIGAAAVSGDNRFAVPRLTNGAQELSVSVVESAFAPGQFLQLDRDESLSRPSFEKMPAGVRLGTVGLRDDGGRRVQQVTFETALLQPSGVRRRPIDPGTIFQPPLNGTLQKMAQTGRTRSTSEAGNPFRNGRAAAAVTIRRERYGLADVMTGVKGAATVGSVTAAEQARRRLMQATPATRLSVVALGGTT